MIPRWLVSMLFAIAALLAAAALGWWLGQPERVVETPVPEQRQADGSLVLERRPDAKAKPAHQVPAGAKVDRVGQMTVKPKSGTRAPNQGNSAAADPCPPVTVDWSLVREPDGGRRMLASSPDGTIIGGVDVPIETAAPPPKPRRWAAGLSWSPTSETGGMWLERDVPLFSVAARVGLDLNQEPATPSSATDTNVRLRVGIAF